MPALRSIAADAAHGKVTFARDTGFHGEVKRRVLAYFERTGLSERDSPRMYLKTAVLLLWFGASYALLVFAATTFWQGALLSLSLGARDGRASASASSTTPTTAPTRAAPPSTA